MVQIIRGLKGHHEPQEELLFHHLVNQCRPGSTIVEIGAFWAYYTNWYLGAVAGSSAVCVEPDANNVACGKRNLALNGRSATWINACVGHEHAAEVTIRRESDEATVSVPCHSLDSLLESIGRRSIEMLHVDCQGAELPLLESCCRAAREGLLRFVVISTHHASISGSPTTHQDCLRQLENLGASILCEHTVEDWIRRSTPVTTLDALEAGAERIHGPRTAGLVALQRQPRAGRRSEAGRMRSALHRARPSAAAAIAANHKAGGVVVIPAKVAAHFLHERPRVLPVLIERAVAARAGVESLERRRGHDTEFSTDCSQPGIEMLEIDEPGRLPRRSVGIKKGLVFRKIPVDDCGVNEFWESSRASERLERIAWLRLERMVAPILEERQDGVERLAHHTDNSGRTVGEEPAGTQPSHGSLEELAATIAKPLSRGGGATESHQRCPYREVAD